MSRPSKTANPATATWREDSSGRVLVLGGDWVEGEMPKGAPKPGEAVAGFDGRALGRFDSGLPAYLLALIRGVEGSEPDLGGLPDGLRNLVELALKVPEREEVRAVPEPGNPLAKLGQVALAASRSALGASEFTGQVMMSALRFVVGRAHFRFRDFWLVLQQCGPSALPIVLLINFLIGSILAFVGAVQLSKFGASLYVADLVAIAMVREMGAVMTGIIMSGRTGAAFAAQIGSMKANEEIDALRTFGFAPFDFLVLPRMLALLIAMPVLTVFANFAGILGGMLVGATVGLPPVLFYHEAMTVLTLQNSFLGVGKSVFFGAAIAMAGCYHGMNAERSSAGVGLATTRAVVLSITAIIVIDSAFAALFTVLDI